MTSPLSRISPDFLRLIRTLQRKIEDETERRPTTAETIDIFANVNHETDQLMLNAIIEKMKRPRR